MRIISFIGRYTLVLSIGSILGLCMLVFTVPEPNMTRGDVLLFGYGGAALVALGVWLWGRR